MRRFERGLTALWIGAAVLMASALAASAWHRAHGAPSMAPSHLPRVSSLKSGDELLVVFIGGSFCGGSAAPGLRQAVARVNHELAARMRLQGKTLVSVGVAMDWSLEDGLRFLHEFGKFDELVVGRNWLNSAVVRYVWRDTPGSAALPQLVVLSRRVTVGPGAIDVGDEQLVVRKVGAAEIIEWANQRAAL